jgi:hypothetical protein
MCHFPNYNTYICLDKHAQTNMPKLEISLNKATQMVLTNSV